MAEGWHTYWSNPGDSGLPTTITWKLPDGVGVGAIQWPAPRALPTGPLVNYGYEGQVLLLTGTHLAARRAGRVDVQTCGPCRLARLQGRLHSRRCRPRHFAARVRPVGSVPAMGRAIAATRAALPTPLQGWQVSARGDGAKVALTLTPPAGAADPGQLQFFPHEEGRIEPSGKQVLARDANGAYTLTAAGRYPAGARIQARRRRRHGDQGLRRGRRACRGGDRRRAAGRHGHGRREAFGVGIDGWRRAAGRRGRGRGAFTCGWPCCSPSSAASS